VCLNLAYNKTADFLQEAKKQASLSAEKRRSLVLMLMGSFLEYFYLMLYVHLAIVLTPRFLPSSDPKVATLLGAFAFCSAYIFRPLGSLIFGYLSDTKGRKACIVLTALLMGLATFIMGVLPSYESIGVAASALFLLARALQGFSSIGESVNAKVFTVELTQNSRYMDFLSILPDFFVHFGSLMALGLGVVCLSLDPVNGWRWPFFFGLTIALISAVIRLKSLESPVFIEAINKRNKVSDDLQTPATLSHLLGIRKKNYWYYFGIELIAPAAWYFSLRICTDLLKDMGLQTSQIIQHNFIVLALYLLCMFLVGYLSLYIRPFTLLKRRYATGLCLLPSLISCLIFTPHHQGLIFMTQLLVLCTFDTPTPALARIINTFPVVGRCTSIGFAYAVSHSCVYVFTAMGSALLQNILGLWGIGGFLLLTGAISLYCVYSFEPIAHPHSSEKLIDPTTVDKVVGYPMM